MDLFYICLYLTILYTGTILFFILNFNKGKPVAVNSISPPGVTVLVPFRNEEQHIESLISSLHQQEMQNAEFILVNDHSTDNSVAIAENTIKLLKDERFIIFHSSGGGKKNAISEAVHLAKNEIILTTDADCVHPKNWINEMVTHLQHQGSGLLFGAVVMQNEKGFVQHFDSLDYLSMQGAGIAAARGNKPFSCSGANLGYFKKEFLKVNPYMDHQNLSGDDVSLLLAYKARGIKISALDTPASIVQTIPVKSLNELFLQRMRWGQKAAGYRDSFALYLSLLVVANCTVLVVGLLYSLIYLNYFKYFLICWALKLVIDFLFLFLVASEWGKRGLMGYFIPAAILHILYIPPVAMIGILMPVSWRGRKISVGKK